MDLVPYSGRSRRINAQRTAAVIPADSRTAPRAAWLLCGLALALICCAAVLAVLNDTDAGELVFFVSVISCAVVGGMVVSRRPANPIGWFLLISSFSFATTMLTENYARYGLIIEPGSLPLARAMVWPQSWLWVPGAVLVLVFVPLYFPDGRLVSRRWRPVVWFGVFFSLLAAAISAIETGEIRGSGLVNPLGFEMAQPVAAVFDAVVLPLWLGLLFVSAASLAIRFRRSGSEQRQQIKYLAFAAAVIPTWFLLNAPVERAFPNLFLVVDALAFAGVPVAVGIAILRYRLYDIDLVINRTLVYGALTTCVVGIYVLVVGYLGAMFRTGGNLAISLVATGVVAVLFAPLREHLQRIVNRLMYGERDDPYVALSRLGQRLEVALAPGDILPTVVKTVAETLKLPHAAIEMNKDGEFSTVASIGEPVEAPLRLPLVHGGSPVGWLVLGTRAGEDAFSPADRRLLDDLARQIGVAVHAARLTDEAVRLSADLQRSRERLVTAREEERRRLRRDLHDGLGPRLAAVTMKAEAARDHLEAYPDRSGLLLEEITTQTQEAVADIRRLVHGLRPPALDELGLLGALRAHAAHGEHGGMCVTIQAPEEPPPLPAAAEVAAYRIAVEAVNNAARHAEGRNCTVRLAVEKPERALILEVTDDGRGIGAERGMGVGLHSMRERAEELGGSCIIESSPGEGTSVQVMLPLAKVAEDSDMSPPISKDSSSDGTYVR